MVGLEMVRWTAWGGSRPAGWRLLSTDVIFSAAVSSCALKSYFVSAFSLQDTNEGADDNSLVVEMAFWVYYKIGPVSYYKLEEPM